MRIVIVGGVAAGITAATRLKRLQEDAEIVIYERGDRISFANCALPYYAGGVVRPEGLYAAKSERLEALYDIEIRERHEVLSIDRDKKCVRVRNLQTNETFDSPYDRLILATGADARILPIEGLRECAHPLWRPEDALRLEEKLTRTPNCRVGIIGGGAVGLETAENVVRRGGTVHLMEYGRTIMGRNDAGLSNAFIRLAESKAKNLFIHTETSVTKAEKLEDATIRLTLSTGESIIVDDVISAAGVMPRSQLAREAGLELGPRDTILTDAFMRTSGPQGRRYRCRPHAAPRPGRLRHERHFALRHALGVDGQERTGASERRTRCAQGLLPRNRDRAQPRRLVPGQRRSRL